MSNGFGLNKHIQNELELFFDIPFRVTGSIQHNDSIHISPDAGHKELFEIQMEFRDPRIIVVAKPQQYAAAMLEDMSNADIEKQKVFITYGEKFLQSGARITVSINGEQIEIHHIPWQKQWKQFEIRITKTPLFSDTDDENVKSAITEWGIRFCAMIMSLLNIEKLDASTEMHYEGGVKQVTSSKYERNPVNRALCLQIHGYHCNICGFDFEKKYGSIGYHFIHVHHIVPVSYMKDAYLLDPSKDLIPVCPNCHAMLHTSDPPLLPDTLRKIIESAEKRGLFDD